MVNIDTIREVYEQCQGAWTGCEWTALHGRWEIDIDGGDPEELRGVASRIRSNTDTDADWERSIVRQIPARDDDKGSAEYMTTAQYRAAVADDLASAADWLDACSSEAESAESKAEEAMEAVEAGNLNEALHIVKQVCGHESTYGDSPTWTPFRRAIEDAITASKAAPSRWEVKACWDGEQYHVSYGDYDWYSVDGDSWVEGDGTDVTGPTFESATITLRGGPRDGVKVG